MFAALFRTADVRRRLKPLNDLAVTAEKLSKEPMDHNKIDDLEKAISHCPRMTTSRLYIPETRIFRV